MSLLLTALALSQLGHYALDPAETELLALTAPAGLLAGASHPHVVAARQVQGEVVFDPADATSLRVSVVVPAAALENDEPALRKRLGFPSMLSEADRKTVAANLRAKSQLDTSGHPTITFVSRAARRLDPEHLELTGTLTLRGVAVELTLPVTATARDGVFRGEGTVNITHAMFGFEPYSAALGTIKNAEGITLRLRLVARIRPEDAETPP
jgi:polyisoprenoid-binding protein YceI